MFLINSAYAQASAGQAPGAGIGQFVFLAGLMVLFYFMLIRPQRKREKEHKEMLSNVGVGDEVATNGGILGKVRKIEGEFLVVKVAPQVELRFQKSAIHAVLPKGTLKAIDG